MIVCKRLFMAVFLVLGLCQFSSSALAAADDDDIPEEIRKKLEELAKKGGGGVVVIGDDDDYNPYADAIPMRWRVYSSQEHGVAFRFPYFYSTPNQYEPRIVRRSSWFMRNGEFQADIDVILQKVQNHVFTYH